jgi:hypothetical protein
MGIGQSRFNEDPARSAHMGAHTFLGFALANRPGWLSYKALMPSNLDINKQSILSFIYSI